MAVLTRFALVAMACAGCSPKGLRFERGDAAMDSAQHDGAAMDAAEATVDEASADVIASDAQSDAAMDGADGVSADAVSADVVSADRAIVDASTVVAQSCASDPTREDCRTVLVVPERSFCVGVPATAVNTTWNASPPLCGLTLSPFVVDAHEVTVARFRVFNERWVARTLPAFINAHFANATTFRAPLPPRATLSEWNPSQLGCTWSDAASPVRDRHPINCVGWALAMYFCAWEGGHLVTSTQYEYLARWHRSAAPEGRTYAWGESAPDCARVHYGPCPGSDGLLTRPVGSLPLGAVDSIFDLAGNVADYVADDFAAYSLLESSACWTRSSLDPLCLPTLAANHFARGSSHMNSSEVILRAVFRPISATSDAAPSRGFRCAYPVR